MNRVLFHEDASYELDQAAGYYEERNAGLGLAFVAEIERACDFVARYPELGAPYKQTELRRMGLRRFPYALYYLDLPEVTWVIAVAHTKRRPDYWKRRRKP